MRRRFGRGKRGRGASGSRHAPIDAARAFERIIAAGIVEADVLEPLGADEIAATFAAVGGAERDGGKIVVGYAPRDAGNAALATVAVAQRLAAEEGFRGEAVAVAPQWSAAARRRLAALETASYPFEFRAVANASLADDDGLVEPDPGDLPALVSPGQIAAGLTRRADRELFRRAAVSFEGLAAKHGGAVRGLDSSVELVLLARRVAAIHAGDSGVQLEVLQEERSTAPLTASGLATAMDQLEGLLRKRLNDRRVRSGEDGLRAQLAPSLAEVAGVRNAKLWPLGGSESEVIDLVGVHDDGRPVVGAIRKQLTLVALGAVLDAALALRPSLPMLLADAGPPLRVVMPRLLLAAKTFDAAALRVLASLALEHANFDVQPRRGREPTLVLREGVAAPAPIAAVSDAGAPMAEGAPLAEKAPLVEGAPLAEEVPPAEEVPGAEQEAPQEAPPARAGGRSRSRGRRGGRRSRGAEASEEAEGTDGEAEAPSFDEISLFDLADDRRQGANGAEEAAPRRSRRGRGRRRRRDRGSGDGEDGLEEPTVAASERDSEVEEADPRAGEESGRPSARRRGRNGGRRGPAAAEDVEDLDATDDIEDPSDTLVPLDEVPDLGEVAEPEYDDDEDEDDEGEDDFARRRREAEQRAIERLGESPEESEPEERLSLPRKRAAIVVHADRASLICGLLLARDLRQIEGFWVYAQEDLMTFFRSVATDLREDTPIYIVGFAASPAREALQAASLYRGRLAWFDHREWPPEDLGAMRDAIGNENVHVMSGAESCLSVILSVRARRSRFSDKIVELATGRFTQHDYERWGRLWWHRLGEIAQTSGERRADLEALLVGRPSDLAKEAAGIPAPPPPPEVEFVSQRDFRLVHFHGFTLVVVPTPDEFDLHLVSRIARERYDAQVSVARVEDRDLVVLGSDEGRGRRNIDLLGMVEHLASKHQWVVPLPGEDHVARLCIRDSAAHPERFDELISEIAMGRSILEW
jgi:hypothetical protein